MHYIYIFVIFLFPQSASHYFLTLILVIVTVVVVRLDQGEACYEIGVNSLAGLGGVLLRCGYVGTRVLLRGVYVGTQHQYIGVGCQHTLSPLLLVIRVVRCVGRELWCVDILCGLGVVLCLCGRGVMGVEVPRGRDWV